MCGIFGYVNVKRGNLADDALARKLARLFKLSETRGKEAAGIALMTGSRLSIYKDAVRAGAMIRTPQYQAFLRRAKLETDSDTPLGVLGHARLVTNGNQVVDANNQPVLSGGVVAVHNGIITNDAAMWAARPKLRRTAGVDTEIVVAACDAGRAEGLSVPQSLGGLMEEVFGETSLGVLAADSNLLTLTTNTGSLFYAISENGQELFFVSERYIALEAIKDAEALPGFAKSEIVQVHPGEIVSFDLGSLQKEVRRFGETKQAPAIGKWTGALREIEEKSKRHEALRQGLRRCSRCVLPETMPHIAFDADGVCNYCRSHRPFKLQGRDTLEKRLEEFRSSARKGDPDCIVGFSGGRDSSYGLHLLVKEFKVRPVAYTYDWGMVTDLGRRNQARMCSSLGVEHVWISADIRQKRENVRKNVSAWLRKPDLGIIPLFMAGDKQYHYHGVDLKKRMQIEHMILCVNVLEKTDFKSGFAGVRPTFIDSDDKDRPIHLLGGMSNVRMAAHYAGEFLANPRYINSSVPDTAYGYWSYYLFKQPYSNLFQYVEWREDTVNDVLLGEYDWELATDSPSSWRIGDATAPFYNYVYHEVAGFTEFDTFRSNQIREGHVTREEALKKIAIENMPRWPSIRDYCAIINIDFEECMRAITRIPKLYERA
jgi:glutamine---fructose-6-phosphate transaminase (isomerizing)